MTYADDHIRLQVIIENKSEKMSQPQATTAAADVLVAKERHKCYQCTS